MILALLLAAVAEAGCPVVRLPSDATFAALASALDRDSTDGDRMRRVETYVAKSALLAAQAVRVYLTFSAPAQRHNAAVLVFPYVVDKDNFADLEPRVPVPPWYAAQPDRAGAGMLIVGPIVAATGLRLQPAICLALAPITDADVQKMQGAVASERPASAQVRAVRAHLRDRTFTAAQAKALIDAVLYRDEKLAAGRLLRARVIDPPAWNKNVCQPMSDWFDCAIDQ
ncbi:MAG: DUF4476 domain-containing protein [Deltaproteobacteria bacterium]|nr:DUF4476 domain-containing protein [Deltaproteobacteria bacterium]